MEIVKESENGKYFITSNAISEIVMKVCNSIDDIIPTKKNSFVECNIYNDKIVVKISIKVKRGIDIDKMYRIIESDVSNTIYDILEINNLNIVIDFNSFEN